MGPPEGERARFRDSRSITSTKKGEMVGLSILKPFYMFCYTFSASVPS